jgi:alkanesulfonate monooxygenase SsuD/methylene tetrahydromethanopterin reductase-like flavin-dependent oxidoreductase (luciferase family)
MTQEERRIGRVATGQPGNGLLRLDCSAFHLFARVAAAPRNPELLGGSRLTLANRFMCRRNAAGRSKGYAFNPLDPLLVPITVLLVLALRTSRFKLGTAVLVLPYRHPI